MSKKFDYLSDRYAKILDLAEMVDPNIIKRIDRYMSCMEDKAVNFIVNEQSFHRTTKDNSSFLSYEVNDKKLELELAESIDGEFRLRKLHMKPLNNKTSACLASEDENDRNIQLIRFTASNMPYDPEFVMNVIQNENNEYKLTGIGTNRVICFEYLLELSYVNNKYIVNSTKLISNCEQYTKEIEISDVDLLDYYSQTGPILKSVTPDDLRDDNVNDNNLNNSELDKLEEDIRKLLDGLDELFGD